MKLPQLPDKIAGSATVTGMIYMSVIVMGFLALVIVVGVVLVLFGEESFATTLVKEVRGFGEWLIALVAGALGIRTGTKNLGGKGNDPPAQPAAGGFGPAAED